MKPLYRTVLPTPQYFLDLISCRKACPVRTDAGAYVRAIAEGDYRRGYGIASAPNAWTSVCARVCAHPCETNCRRGKLDEPVSIRALKRTLAERHGPESAVSHEAAAEIEPLRLAARAGGAAPRVAVVGAGPAGLACAHDLAFLGYRVTVFESAPVPGGMLFQGIPEYRLPRDIIRAQVDRILRLGITIQTSWRLGRDFTVQGLRRDGFAAVFLAFGATRGRDLRVPGSQLDGVINGVEFLLNANLGFHVPVGTRVAVIGGGNVAVDVARTALRYGADALPDDAGGYDHSAMDAARTALRLGARLVTMLSLERRQEMPAADEEIAAAQDEGIEVLAGRGPKQFLGQRGRLTAVETLDVASVFDESGRFNPQFVAGSERTVECDTAILAIGQTPDLTALAGDPDIAVTARGLVQVEPKTLETSVPGVYCGGDLAFGPRIMIEAAGDGKRAALAIHRRLGGSAPSRAPLRFRALERTRWAERYDRVDRQAVPELPVARRTGFREVELPYTDADARREGKRCLWCNVSPIFDSARCVLCGGCVDVCPESCLKLVRVDRLGEPAAQAARELAGDPRAGAIIKDEERCIRCGLCAERCPARAITMEVLEVDYSPTASLRLFGEECGEFDVERQQA